MRNRLSLRFPVNRAINEFALLTAQQLAISSFPTLVLAIIGFKYGVSSLGELAKIISCAYITLPFVVYSFDINFFQKAIHDQSRYSLSLLSASSILFRLIVCIMALCFIYLSPTLNLIPKSSVVPAQIIAVDLFSYTLQQSWLKNALSQNISLAVGLACAKIASICGLLISDQTFNITHVAYWWSLPSFAVSIGLYLHTFKQLNLYVPTLNLLWNEILAEISVGKYLMLMSAQVYIFKDSTPSLLSLCGFNDLQVGVYTIAEKTIQTLITLSRPYRTLLSRNFLAAAKSNRIKHRSHVRLIISAFSKKLIYPPLLISLVTFCSAIFSAMCIQNTEKNTALLIALLVTSTPFAIYNGFWSGPPSSFFKSQKAFFAFASASSLFFLIIVTLIRISILPRNLYIYGLSYGASELILFLLIHHYLSAKSSMKVVANV